MTSVEDSWPNEAGFDTNYEQHEPVALTVRGTIPYYAAGVLCVYPSKELKGSRTDFVSQIVLVLLVIKQKLTTARYGQPNIGSTVFHACTVSRSMIQMQTVW
jgi:hypothetical protein